MTCSFQVSVPMHLLKLPPFTWRALSYFSNLNSFHLHLLKISPAVPTVFSSLGFSANIWGLLDHHQYGSSAYEQKIYLKKLFSWIWGKVGEQEQTNQAGWSFVVPNASIYCFPVNLLSRPCLWDFSSQILSAAVLLTCFSPQGFWGLCCRAVFSFTMTLIGQNAYLLYVQLYYGQLIPTVWST